MGVTGFVSVRFVSAFYYSVSSPSPPFHWLRIPGQLPNDCGGKDFASSCNNGKRRSLSLSVCLSVCLSLSLYIYIYAMQVLLSVVALLLLLVVVVVAVVTWYSQRNV